MNKFFQFHWFPLLRRFLWAWSAFLYAWQNPHPWRHWSDGYYTWIRKNNLFVIGDYALLRGPMHREHGFADPNGIEPFILKKLCVNDKGDVRYFDVVPEGWEKHSYD